MLFRVAAQRFAICFAIPTDGKLKVLDFGLAKAFEAEASKSNLSQSPTLSMAATNAGVILAVRHICRRNRQGDGEWIEGRTSSPSLRILRDAQRARRPLAARMSRIFSVLSSEPNLIGGRFPVDTPMDIRKLLLRCLERFN